MRQHQRYAAGRLVFLCATMATCAAARGADAGKLAPSELRCEARTDPPGIDVTKPRLSWLVTSSERAQKQTAYRVLVASSAEKLGKDEGDLWDSGQVKSDATFNVEYAGKPLSSHAKCFWKVKVWDRDGAPSAWSTPASWSMGMLAKSDWKAEWIGYDKPREIALPEAPLEGAQWIWFSGDKKPAKPQGARVFLSELRLPADAKVGEAKLIVAADDRYSFNINGQMAAANQPGISAFERAREVVITPLLKPGKNTIRVQVDNASEGPAGLLAKITVKTSDGKTHTLVTDDNWRSTDQPGANWHAREIDPASWPAASILGPYGTAPWGKLKIAALYLPPPPLLRTTFEVKKPVRRAVVYATALGVFDLYCNGKRISDDQFNPGWTDYNKRVYYRAYDVTDRIKSGKNALGAILSDGWYSGYIGWMRIRDHYGKKPRLLAQLHIEYEDGSTAEVASNAEWKASTGATREADFLMGESFDARLEKKDWAEPSFDDSRWDAVDKGADLHPVVQAHPGPPVRAFAELRPKKVTEPRRGAYVLDLGRNFAGVVRLTVNGEPGQTIRLRFAERLNPDGTLYTTNLRDARVIDTYICKGGGPETWQPRFTFHGFQYVEVTGLKSPPGPEAIVGVALSSDTPVAGSFECASEMLNTLHGNIYWTQRANFIDIPTDCPQRDERLGWTGDAQVYARTASLNTDVQAFFTKWLVDLEDGQRADGQFPMIAPVKVAGDDGGPAWADAGVICPWTMYEVYGDKRLLAQHYASMCKFIEFCRARSESGTLPPKEFHCFGDWLNINAETPKDVIYTAYYARSTFLTARAAQELGKDADTTKYLELFDRIKAAFNKAYVSADGRIKGDTQTAYVLALAFDLLDKDKAKLAAEHLVADIAKRGGHLSTGFVGTRNLMPVLSQIGRTDIAYKLLLNDTFPSWGFSIKQGATSIWERWDGWTPEKGFQDPGMNSFAHYSFGAVYQWMFENIGGIKSFGPAYREILVEPKLDDRLEWAKTSYRSKSGLVATDWKHEGDTLRLRVTIPTNTKATVFLTADRPEQITESGKPLDKSEGVRLMHVDGGRGVLSVASGTYEFTSPWPRSSKPAE